MSHDVHVSSISHVCRTDRPRPALVRFVKKHVLCVAMEYVWWPFDGRVMTSAVQLVRSEKEPGRRARTVV